MKRKAAVTAVLSCLLAMSAAVPAMAAEAVDYVYLSIVSEDDLYEIEPGIAVSGMEPMLWEEDSCTIVDYNVSGDTDTPKVRYTYSIELEAEDGYRFDRNTIVSVYGSYDVSFSLRNNNRTMIVLARTYPFYVLEEVTGIQIGSDGMARWNEVDCAKNYSVCIYYETVKGKTGDTKKTVKTNEIDLSKYTDEEKYAWVTISVKALADVSAIQKDYILESNYVFDDGEIDDEHYVDYYEFTNIPCDYTAELPAGVSGNPFDPNTVYVNPSTKPSTTTPPGAVTPPSTTTPPASKLATTPSAQADGWYGSGDDWYYIKNGQQIVGDWLNSCGDEWYFFDALGDMCHGWLNVGGEVYWLNESHDGTFGRMLAGYRIINGKTFYFNDVHDGSYGALYVNRRTPDGRYAGVDGVVR